MVHSTLCFGSKRSHPSLASLARWHRLAPFGIVSIVLFVLFGIRPRQGQSDVPGVVLRVIGRAKR